MSADSDVMEMTARVLELEAKVAFLYRHLNVAYFKDFNEADRKVVDEIKKGNILEAIKIYREIYHVDLANAKRVVDEMRSKLGL